MLPGSGNHLVDLADQEEDNERRAKRRQEKEDREYEPEDEE